MRRADWNDGRARSISLSSLIHAMTEATNPDTDAKLLFSSAGLTDIGEACRTGYAADPHLGPILRELSDDSVPATRRFSLQDGLLFFQLRSISCRRLCVPDTPSLRKAIMFEEHDVPTRRHPGQAKSLLLLLEKYYWKGMAQSVEHYVSSCELCQRNKSFRGKAAGLLYPLNIPDKRWEDIRMDFLSPLPVTATGFDAALIIVDLTHQAGSLFGNSFDCNRGFYSEAVF
ncbi:unnamed protein product [Phytophthora lilii]|uniref:Unnamed protein product n=1 Tax=Phytophthora lilii TaxID=2077276 RepID=A0A9W6X4J6_9STRA|nr:unnamed protein product [Phytophthora lilii]